MMRGQAFDVFKLMIAAVVAVAILAILMGILGQITVPGADPMDMMKNLLSKSKQAPKTISISDAEARFSAGTVYYTDSLMQAIGGSGIIKFKCSSSYDAAITEDCSKEVSSLAVTSGFSAKIKACCSGTPLACKVGIGADVTISC